MITHEGARHIIAHYAEYLKVIEPDVQIDMIRYINLQEKKDELLKLYRSLHLGVAEDFETEELYERIDRLEEELEGEVEVKVSLTEHETEVLKALKVLGFEWIARDKYKESSQYNKAYADQMFDDIETYLTVMIDYVEQYGNLDNFNDYFLSYHKELYDRINNYEDNHK